MNYPLLKYVGFPTLLNYKFFSVYMLIVLHPKIDVINPQFTT